MGALDGRRILLGERGHEFLRALGEDAAHRGAALAQSPDQVQRLVGQRAHTDLFDRADEADIGHIKLARDADAVVVAPLVRTQRTEAPRSRNRRIRSSDL
jgi:phosphopantothenoylcysteine decarboxylase/phosphopantothenate--cysteine ligase